MTSIKHQIFPSFRKTKKLWILLILWELSCNVYAQNYSCPKANNAYSSLIDIIDKTRSLDLLVTENVYGNPSYETYTKYNNRLNQAQKMLVQLDQIDKDFKECADKFPNSTNYLLNSSISKLTALNILFKKQNYLNHLMLDANTLKQYEDLKDKWESKERENLKLARSQVSRLLIGDKSNEYLQILNAICLFYDKKTDKAIVDLKTIVDALKIEITQKKSEAADVHEKEKNLSFALTWLGFMHAEKSNVAQASIYLEEVNSIDEPDSRCIDWIDHCKKQNKEAKVKCCDLKVAEITIPTSTGNFEWKALKFQNANNTSEEFNLLEVSTPLITNQRELIKQTTDCWNRLVALENVSWQLYVERIQQTDGKLSSDDYAKLFVKLTPDNKGAGPINLLRYRERFVSGFELLNHLQFLRQCWSALITSNPEIGFYKLYRTKTDLGIYYLSQNSKSFTEFLDYYKLNKKSIPTQFAIKIKESFEISVLNELNDDIRWCIKENPENPMYILTNVEVAVLSKSSSEALSYINEVKPLIVKATPNFPGYDGALEMYKSYVHFKMKNMGDLKQSVQILSAYGNASDWNKDLKNYIYLFENENKVKK